MADKPIKIKSFLIQDLKDESRMTTYILTSLEFEDKAQLELFKKKLKEAFAVPMGKPIICK